MDHEVVEALAERDQALRDHAFPDRPQYLSDPMLGSVQLERDGSMRFINVSPSTRSAVVPIPAALSVLSLIAKPFLWQVTKLSADGLDIVAVV